MFRNLHDPTFFSIAFDLPVLDRCLFTTERCYPSHPEYTRTFLILGSRVVGKDPCLATERPDIKRILHQEDDIDVLWIRLVSDKGTKDDESDHLPGFHHPRVDTPQSLRQNRPLKTAFAKMLNDITQGSVVNPGGKISILIKLWPSFYVRNCKSKTKIVQLFLMPKN
jgi:hypothetical protein